jgi:hypothetical protein
MILDKRNAGGGAGKENDGTPRSLRDVTIFFEEGIDGARVATTKKTMSVASIVAETASPNIAASVRCSET